MALFDLPEHELESYRPEIREPAGFDAFWGETLERTRERDITVALAPAPITLAGVEIQDATFPGFGGHPIKAWYARPAGVDGPLPCVVEVNGYGGGRGLPIERTMWAAAGYAHFYMDTRGQGAGWGNGGDTADPVGSMPSTPGFMTRGITDPFDYYYRRVFTDAVRAVEAARSLPGVDADQVAFVGGSQGGGIALAVAGLVPDLAGVVADVPFLCHFERSLELTNEFPYGEVVKYLSIFRGERERTLDVLSYFDGVNHAKRATAPTLMSVALMDMVCPPSTGYAAFNWYGDRSAPDVRKEMVVYPYNGHEGGQAHQTTRQLEFVRSLFA
ncbi:acetylxylan esterase [Demequina aestuarii]|uniref:acetylxylan esterase n=1 Tax=Demequina aestuarii TaxID=327095 RepID=UPI000782389A|nr:acetylxylan esterase [Demequina aestuarii]